MLKKSRLLILLYLIFQWLSTPYASAKDEVTEAIKQSNTSFQAFAEHFGGRLEAHDIEYLDTNFYQEPMKQQIKTGLDNYPVFMIGAMLKLDKALNKLPSQLINSYTKGYIWRLINADKENKTALFRIEFTSGGYSYLKFSFIKHNGSWRTTDWYDFVTNSAAGENMLSLLILLRNSSQFNQDDNLKRDRFIRAIKSKQYKEAVNVFTSMPEKLKQKSLLQTLYIKAISQIPAEDPLYLNSLKKFIPLVHNDPKNDFFLIDYHILTGDYKTALEKVRRFRKRVNNDLAMLVLEGDIYNQQKLYNQTFEVCKQALDEDDSFEGTYYTLLDSFVLSSRFEEAVLVLNVLYHKFDRRIKKENLITIEGYQSFIDSNQYKHWSQSFSG